MFNTFWWRGEKERQHMKYAVSSFICKQEQSKNASKMHFNEKVNILLFKKPLARFNNLRWEYAFLSKILLYSWHNN